LRRALAVIVLMSAVVLTVWFCAAIDSYLIAPASDQ
jgi:hypothetical protein